MSTTGLHHMRDFASLAINYARIHGEPMPVDLQLQIIAHRAARGDL